MSIIGSKRVRCHGELKTVKIHEGEHGGKYYLARKKGGGTKREYL